MLVVVPAQRAHPVAGLDAQGRQGIGQFLDPRMQVPVGHDMEGAIGLPRDNELGPEDALRMLQNAAHCHGQGHHETVHGLDHPCGEQCCTGRAAGTKAPDRDGEDTVGSRWRSRWNCATFRLGRNNLAFRPFQQHREPSPRQKNEETAQSGWDAPRVPPRDRNFPGPGFVGVLRRAKLSAGRDSTGFAPVSGIRCGAALPDCRRRSSGPWPPRAARRRSTAGRSRVPQSGPGRPAATRCT